MQCVPVYARDSLGMNKAIAVNIYNEWNEVLQEEYGLLKIHIVLY